MIEPVVLTYPVPLKGLNTDSEPTEFSDAFSPYMKNAFVEITKVRKRRGYNKLGKLDLPLVGVGMESVDYTDARGIRHAIVLTTLKAYKYNSTEDGWDCISPFYKEIHACESGWNAGTSCTVAYDTTYFQEGAKSLKVTLTGARTDGDELAYSSNFTAIDTTTGATTLGLWVRSNVAVAAGALEIVLSEAAAGAKSGSYSVTANASAIAANTWTRIDVAVTLTGMDAVISVGVFANSNLASGTILYIDSIEVYKPFTGNNSSRWSWCLATDTSMFSNNGGTALIVSNGVDDILYYEGHTSDIFKTLVHGSGFVTVKEITEFWNHLFFANFGDSLQNVRSLAYASAGDVDRWGDGTSGANTLTDTVGKLMRIKKFGSSIVLYSEDSITMGRYYGGTTIFTFPTMVYNTGLLADKAIWDFVNVHYLLSTDQRVYAYYGETQLQPVGENIEKALFNDIDINKKAMISAGLDVGRHKVHFFIPKASDTYAKCSYCFNYRSSELSWEYHEFADSIRDVTTFSNSFAWYCDEAPWSTRYCDIISIYCDNSYGQTGYNMSIFVSDDGYVYKMDEAYGKDDDSNIVFEVQTPDFVVNREEQYGRWEWFSFQAYSAVAGSDINIFYSVDSGNSWSLLSGSPVSITRMWDTYRLPLDAVSRRIRFKLYQDSDKDVQLRGLFKCKVVPQSDRD